MKQFTAHDKETKSQTVVAMLLRPEGTTYAEVKAALEKAGLGEQTYLKYYARRSNIRLEITKEQNGRKRYRGYPVTQITRSVEHGSLAAAVGARVSNADATEMAHFLIVEALTILCANRS